jgi:hypothetical protein
MAPKQQKVMSPTENRRMFTALQTRRFRTNLLMADGRRKTGLGQRNSPNLTKKSAPLEKKQR